MQPFVQRDLLLAKFGRFMSRAVVPSSFAHMVEFVIEFWPIMPINTNKLLKVERINPNEFLKSNSTQYILKMQTDCNLVVYDVTIANPDPAAAGQAIWASNTEGRVPGYAQLGDDGNFVIYDVANQNIWNTGTSLPTKRGVSLVLQDDGNLVLYGIMLLLPLSRTPTTYNIILPLPLEHNRMASISLLSSKLQKTC
jgi:hypothetical protein